MNRRYRVRALRVFRPAEGPRRNDGGSEKARTIVILMSVKSVHSVVSVAPLIVRQIHGNAKKSGALRNGKRHSWGSLNFYQSCESIDDDQSSFNSTVQ